MGQNRHMRGAIDKNSWKMEQIWADRNISESDPLAKVANNSSTLIFRTLQ